ncbi:MAG: IS30 family transposase [Gemmatimonadota bacterium]|nr:IS30 family transposase [Gemmatimonadota bacterium]
MGQGSGPAHRLTHRERLELQHRVRAGETHLTAALAIGCSAKSVQRILRKTGGLKPRMRPQSALRLSLAEREEISRGLLAGDSCRMIAGRLGRSPSTVSRDVATNGARVKYRAWRADNTAHRRARRPKTPKILACLRLRIEVESGLAHRWSPQQISARLVRDHPDDLEMRVSHETIYQSLFVQGRGALRQELTRCLRSGRAQRRPHGRIAGMGQLRDMVLISDRPAEIEDRAIPGHWEGDLILGKQSRSAIGTLVERQTRFVMLVNLNGGRLAADVKDALIDAVQSLPTHLRLSLTWDQGKEMGEHLPFTVATGVQVYFCDPRSPWQRATNENSNGLLRQYFPKGTDLSGYTQARLDAVAAELNGRPRQTLGWQSPSEAFAALLR